MGCTTIICSTAQPLSVLLHHHLFTTPPSIYYTIIYLLHHHLFTTPSSIYYTIIYLLHLFSLLHITSSLYYTSPPLFTTHHLFSLLHITSSLYTHTHIHIQLHPGFQKTALAMQGQS